MKYSITLLLLILVTFNSMSQANPDEIEFVQSLYGMDKREIVEEFIEMDEAQTADFWRLYDEYEVKRKDLGKQTYELLQKYVNEYGEVNSANADNFMKKAIQLRIKTDNLRDSYYKKMKSGTDAVVAMQFYQVERYISDLVRIELLEQIYTTNKQ